MIWTIAQRDLQSLFFSPLAWIILAMSQVILAYLFIHQLNQFLDLQAQFGAMQNAPGATEMVAMPTLANIAIILLLITPLLTMRLISDERRQHTLSLLFSAPVSMSEIILGKYLSMLLFMLLVISLFSLMPLSLLIGGRLDFGLFASGLLGLLLLLASFSAAGLYASCLTEQPAVAAVISFGFLIILWLGDWAVQTDNTLASLFAYISLLTHYEPLLQGQINSADLFYYLLFSLTFLVLSIRRLDADRLQH
ncbi:MAG: ABC transporter permease subunit [Gammaproteobacteria bacterium]|nr:ABC transporter permease subunit [Gammaproteobacteria bacterium]MDH5727989.1 ABC transporter permease subunit [Gammaproteobacteria bacterium]